jgi:hypothetical protein
MWINVICGSGPAHPNPLYNPCLEGLPLKEGGADQGWAQLDDKRLQENNQKWSFGRFLKKTLTAVRMSVHTLQHIATTAVRMSVHTLQHKAFKVVLDHFCLDYIYVIYLLVCLVHQKLEHANCQEAASQ